MVLIGQSKSSIIVFEKTVQGPLLGYTRQDSRTQVKIAETKGMKLGKMGARRMIQTAR